MPVGESKQRGDAEIDKLFKTEKQREEFFVASESRNLYETQTILRRDYKVTLSLNTISRWLGKVRKERADLRFQHLLVEIKDDALRAESLAKEIGSARKLTDANVTMLSQALFRARQAGDPRAMKHSAVLLSMLLDSVSKAKSAEASVVSAETQKARFQFDAAKAALAVAGELQEISKSKGSEQEKVNRAVDKLFGAKPKTDV